MVLDQLVISVGSNSLRWRLQGRCESPRETQLQLSPCQFAAISEQQYIPVSVAVTVTVAATCTVCGLMCAKKNAAELSMGRLCTNASKLSQIGCCANMCANVLL